MTDPLLRVSESFALELETLGVRRKAKRGKKRCCRPHKRVTPRIRATSLLFFFSLDGHIIDGGAAQGLPQSGVKASPALRHRLPLGQVGKLAVRLGTIFRLSVPVRIARLARTDCRGTCRSRGRCSPPMSQQGGISNISTHLIPWLQKQI